MTLFSSTLTAAAGICVLVPSWLNHSCNDKCIQSDEYRNAKAGADIFSREKGTESKHFIYAATRFGFACTTSQDSEVDGNKRVTCDRHVTLEHCDIHQTLVGDFAETRRDYFKGHLPDDRLLDRLDIETQIINREIE